MNRKEYERTTHQSKLIFKKNTVEKIYLKDHEKNHLSSVKNEIYCLNKFSDKNKYGPRVFSYCSESNSYIMERYDFSLGNTKRISEPNVRRLLFSCSLKQVLRQLNEIENILKERKIVHKDINPGNLLFCESERRFKLIDFYWASTENINTKFVKGINGIYKEDPKAFSRIRKQIRSIDRRVRADVENSKTILRRMGKPYYDGSAKHRGKTYHPIDIHYYKGNLYHKDIDYEFGNIMSNIVQPVESVIDIGCAAGYYAFNFMRMHNINKYNGYEADPNMLSFLKSAKNIFQLDEFLLNGGVNPSTQFEDADVVICMNVHMWLEKQFGREVEKIISSLIKKSKVMFFQTAGANSSGMYKVPYLKSKEDIQDYLKRLGDKKIELIGKSKRGGKRYLFKIGDF